MSLLVHRDNMTYVPKLIILIYKLGMIIPTSVDGNED